MIDFVGVSLYVAQVSAEMAQGWEKVGIVGILVAGLALLGGSFMWGWVVPRGQHQQVVAERDSLRDENKRLWEEKVSDARQSKELAEALIRAMEREKNA